MNYQVLLNNGQAINLTNASFDSNDFTNILNEQTIVFVNISGAIINKHLIQMIVPSEVIEVAQ